MLAAVSIDWTNPLLWALEIGWIMTVILHEFAHGIVAYWGGDYTIKERGGLTLNPLHYVNPMMTIILPLVYLAMGGIPLPGAATLIRRDLIRNKGWESAVSAAGPAMNILIFLLLCLVLHPRTGWINYAVSPLEWTQAQKFVAGLAYAQVLVTVLNLLPVPPLDGFGIISPYLPVAFRQKVASPPWNWMPFIGLILLLQVDQVATPFYHTVNSILDAMGIDSYYTQVAFEICLRGPASSEDRRRFRGTEPFAPKRLAIADPTVRGEDTAMKSGLFSFCARRAPAFLIVAWCLSLGTRLCRAADAAAPAAPQKLPTFGVEIAPPPSWIDIGPDRLKSIGIWISPDSKPPKPLAIIKMELVTIKEKSPQATADAMAKSWGAPPSTAATPLDGEPAFQISAPSPAAGDHDTLAPTDGIVAFHHGFCYLLMAGAVSGHSPTTEFQAMCKSWKWIDFEPAWKHLELSTNSLAACNGTFTIRVPAVMRLLDSARSPTLQMGLQNPADVSHVFTLYIKTIPRDATQLFGDLKQQLAEGIRTTFNLPAAPVWVDRGNGHPCVVLQTFEGTPPNPPGAKSVKMIYALMGLRPDCAVLMTCTMSAQSTPEEQKAYETAVGEMVDSVAPIAPENNPVAPAKTP